MVHLIGRKRTPNKRSFALLFLIATVAGCHNPPHQTPQASASPIDFCVELGGTWGSSGETCDLTKTNDSGDTIKITLKYPKDLLDNPTSGPPLESYLQQFTQRFSHPPKSPLRHTGNANVQASVTDHPPSTKSVVFHEDWFIPGTAHPNEEFATFTFDLAEGKQLQLTDLLCPGVDPLKALPPLARPYVLQALSSTSGSYASAFTAEQFEPNGQPGSFADDYRAWALDGQDLVLYMPAERGPGGMPAGFLHPRIPLSAMHSILRDSGCSA